jgi:hypothetical protein
MTAISMLKIDGDDDLFVGNVDNKSVNDHSEKEFVWNLKMMMPLRRMI